MNDKFHVELDFDNPVSVGNDEHAHHTGWAWDPEGSAFVLTLHREDGSVLAAACYTYENWMDVFERLKEAHQTIIGGVSGNDNQHKN